MGKNILYVGNFKYWSFVSEFFIDRCKYHSNSFLKLKISFQIEFRMIESFFDIAQLCRQTEMKMVMCCTMYYVRVSLWNHRHFHSERKRKIYSSTLRFNYFKVITVEVESFFRPFQPRPEERKKLNFWKEPQRRPHTIINFLSSQNRHSLRAFSQFWEQENSRWIDDQVKVGEEVVESRECKENRKILDSKSGMALKRRRSKWLIFRLFLPVPYTAYPSKSNYNSQNGG